MLLEGEFLDDFRVKKEAISLSKIADVVVMTSNLDNRPEREEYKGIGIIRIKAISTKSVKFVYDTWVAITKVHPLFYKEAARYIEKQDQVIVHVHDLPLVGTGIKLKKRFSQVKFLVSDFHENYPEGLKGWNERRKNIIVRLRNKIFFGQRRWTKYEAYAIAHSDKVIAVIREMKDYLIEKHNIPSEKLFLVPNSASASFGKELRSKTLAKPKDEEFVILYIGGIGDHRGLDAVIKAIALLKEEIPQIKFIIYGKGNNDIIGFLQGIVDDLDLQKEVEFNDWVDISEIPALMKKAHINVIPHKSNLHTDHTMPNKIYQMLLIGQPILVSSCKPIKRIVQETNSGKVFTADDANSCGEEIRAIYTNYEALVEDKDRIIELGEKNYSWERSAEEFNAFYQDLIEQC